MATDAKNEQKVECESSRNGINVSCEIVKSEDEPHAIWVWVETKLDLSKFEGDIRQRISEELNKAVRAIEKPQPPEKTDA